MRKWEVYYEGCKRLVSSMAPDDEEGDVLQEAALGMFQGMMACHKQGLSREEEDQIVQQHIVGAISNLINVDDDWVSGLTPKELAKLWAVTPDEADPPDIIYERKLRDEALYNAVDGLPSPEREVIDTGYFDPMYLPTITEEYELDVMDIHWSGIKMLQSTLEGEELVNAD